MRFITQRWLVLALSAVMVMMGTFCSVNAEETAGTFTDKRDGKKYKTAKINEQVWMAQNLNIKTGKSWCYDNKESNCNKYGRLYDWNTAMKVCPAGWHLPSSGEWNGVGDDGYGLSALPGGYRGTDGGFHIAGWNGFWWMATENGSGSAYSRYMHADGDFVASNRKEFGFSVRCVIDSPLQAHNKAQELVAMLPSIKEVEAKAARIRELIEGEWVFTEKAKSIENPSVDAVTTKIFRFDSDGKVHLEEKKIGQSSPYLKEDWLFESWGTYDCKGDTVMISINRFAAVRNMFKRLHKVDGKEIWRDEPAPTYDSAITDGSQDRYVIYDDFILDFKKVK